MTTYFVSAVDGNNADSGLTWALAKQTVAGALAVPPASGDTIVVDNAGTFTAGLAITWTLIAGNIAIISVTRSGTVSFTPAAGAVESIGASNTVFTISQGTVGNAYIYGMTLTGGNGAASTLAIGGTSGNYGAILRFSTCTFTLAAANVGAQLVLGTAARRNIHFFDSCTILVSGSRAGNIINITGGDSEFVNLTISTTGGTKPVSMIATGALNVVGSLRIRDSDLTGFATAASAYVLLTNLNNQDVLLENCKLHATPTLTSGTWPGGAGNLLVRNCDSGDTINTFQYQNAYGTLTQSTSIYVGADGQFNAAGISWQIVTTSVAGQHSPFVTPYIEKWTTLTTLQTSEIQITYDSATLLTDQDIWSEIEFAASASFPNYTYQTNRNAQPITGSTANQTTSTATWTGTGGFSNPQKQQLQNALTAAEVGLLRVKVYVGKATTTLYVSPDIEGIS